MFQLSQAAFIPFLMAQFTSLFLEVPVCFFFLSFFKGLLWPQKSRTGVYMTVYQFQCSKFISVLCFEDFHYVWVLQLLHVKVNSGDWLMLYFQFHSYAVMPCYTYTLMYNIIISFLTPTPKDTCTHTIHHSYILVMPVLAQKCISMNANIRMKSCQSTHTLSLTQLHYIQFCLQRHIHHSCLNDFIALAWKLFLR